MVGAEGAMVGEKVEMVGGWSVGGAPMVGGWSGLSTGQATVAERRETQRGMGVLGSAAALVSKTHEKGAARGGRG
jgi:hypothetical protein